MRRLPSCTPTNTGGNGTSPVGFRSTRRSGEDGLSFVRWLRVFLLRCCRCELFVKLE